MTTLQIPKSLVLSREFHLKPDREFEPVDLKNRKRQKNSLGDAASVDLDIEQRCHAQALKKVRMENQFSSIELEFIKRSFFLDLKQRKAYQGSLFDCLVSRFRLLFDVMNTALIDNMKML